MSNNCYSIVEIFGGPTEGHRCGYCKSPNNSISYGMWAHDLTIQDYQDLIDRGWRRSGKYCYKPIMDQTCCPSYAIRCDTPGFKLSKSQKKVLRRMNHYLRYGNTKEHADNDCQLASGDPGGVPSEQLDLRFVKEKSRLASQNLQDKILLRSSGGPETKESVAGLTATTSASGDTTSFISPKVLTSSGLPASTNSLGRQPSRGVGADPAKPPCKKAKVLRKERRQQKMVVEHNSLVQIPGKQQQQQQKCLSQYLDESPPADAAHTFEVTLVRSQPPSPAFHKTFDEAYELYKKYQMTVHGDLPDSCKASQFSRFLVCSPLEIKLIRSEPASSEFESSVDESFLLYKRYQMEIHGETDQDTDVESYLQFLVESPLKPEESTESLHPGYGSFHQQYRLDGKLVAVGVLDILPHCVSSVYFYYDPAYSFLSFGTYGALREIAFVQELSRCAANLKYYYMGFYIHSCVKMRYKGRYHPSYLLCPEVYSWHPLPLVQHKLDSSKYSRLNDVGTQEDENGKVTGKDIMVLQRQRPISFTQYSAGDKEREEVLEYGRYVGKKCAPRMLLFRK